MVEIKSPARFKHTTGTSVFLAGSIEMGSAVDWQQEIVNSLELTDITVFNPRRDDWDSSWVQTFDNPQFNQQVNWELDALDHASIVVFYFAPNTMSPISLMELGLMASTKKVVVCCPNGFWRKGNVDIVCSRYSITVVETVQELIESIKKVIDNV